MGLGGRGHDTQTCQNRQVRGPDKPSQALTLEGIVDASSGRLPGKLQAADKKEEQHLAFSERGRRVRTQCPFDASNFVQPFIRFFCYPSKIPCRYRHYVFFLFKIRSQYTWFSLFWLCTEVQKSQPLSPFIASRFPTPPLLFAVGWVRRECADSAPHSPRSPDPASNAPEKWSNMQLVFQHGPISRESKNIKTIVTIWNGYSRK